MARQVLCTRAMPWNSLLAAVLLSASPQVAPSATPSTEQSHGDAPRHAAWIRPMSATLSVLSNDLRIVSGGVHLPLMEDLGLVLELTVVRGEMDDWNPVEHFTRVGVSAGPLFSSRTRLSGFFAQPKLIAMVMHEPDFTFDGFQPKPHEGGLGFQLKVGVEAGWQFVAGPLYGSVSTGVSSGACFNCVDEAATGQMMGPKFSGAIGERVLVSPALDFQIDLLRLGVAF
jgi:hypothetical protein